MVLPPLALAFAWLGAGSASSALVMGPSAARRALGVLLAVATLGAPFMLDPRHTALRGLLALAGTLCVVRSIDLARDARPWPAADRLMLHAVLFDWRQVVRRPATLSGRGVLHSVGFGLLTAGGVLTVAITPADGSLPNLLARWLGGLVLIYSMADAAGALTVTLWRAGGFELPPQHRHPILARSIAEFWGERWNLNVSAWLGRHCFKPLARRGRPLLGVAAAFAASTLIHVWFVWVALDLTMAALMGSFFVLQGVLVLIERRLRVARFSTPAAHAWTAGLLLLTSPLFVEPFVRVLFGPP